MRAGGERHESLRYAARLEIGLRAFLDDGGFRAFTTNFEDLGGLRQLPGIAVQRLMADGYGFGGEGDWKTSVLVRTLKAMAVGVTGGTSFMEDYTYDLTPGQELVLGAHMLEVCPTIAADVPTVEIHPLSIGGREDPVRLVFDAEPGPAVVLGLADMGERFRLVANEIDVVPPPQPLRSLPVARAVWRPRPHLSGSAESWIIAGAPAPHRAVPGGGGGGAARPRRHGPYRTRRHRRRHRAPQVRRRDSLEPGLLPACPWFLTVAVARSATGAGVHCSRSGVTDPEHRSGHRER